MVGLFESPRDVRKRQEPIIGAMDLLLLEYDIRKIINKKEKKTAKEAYQQALSDYMVAKLDLERAKRRYHAQVDAIRTRLGLPKFLDS